MPTPANAVTIDLPLGKKTPIGWFFTLKADKDDATRSALSHNSENVNTPVSSTTAALSGYRLTDFFRYSITLFCIVSLFK